MYRKKMEGKIVWVCNVYIHNMITTMKDEESGKKQEFSCISMLHFIKVNVN